MTDDPNNIWYRYIFQFDDGTQKEFLITIDRETLTIVSDKKFDPPEWTKIEFDSCDCCPLQEGYCPVALNLAQVVTAFADSLSHQKVHVTVECNERTYSKTTTLQFGLSSMIGILMATGTCPQFSLMRPVVRYHLPFSTVDERLYRYISAYLTTQYVKLRKGETPDWELKGLVEMYKGINLVNKAMSRRLAQASQKDAAVNAIIILFSFADSFSFLLENGLDDIMRNFDR